jgi:hypothetical protein
MNYSTLPPPLPSKPSHTIFHQVATASAVAPVIAIGLTMVSSAGRTGMDPQTQRSVSFMVGIASSIIILIGVICGIVALCGIPQHGKKGILGRALCGIIIPVLFAGLAIPNFIAAREKALKNKQYQMSPEGQLSALADRINKQGHKMIDEITRLEGAEALPNRTLLYKYSLITKTSSEITPNVLEQVVRPNIVKNYSAHPDMKMFRDNGVTLTYRYRDKTGQLIGDISVGPRDLGK